MPNYFYNNQNITMDILMKIEQVVRILADKTAKPFDEVLYGFYKSRTFNSLKNPQTCMWSESAEFIASDYEREAGAVL